MKKNILILTGEASGDMRGAELLAILKKEMPDEEFWGFGGERLRKEGVLLIEHIKNLSLVGIWEVVLGLRQVLRQMKKLKKTVRQKKPSMAILIDYPGMNLRIARFLKKENVPVVYYVIPQLWAWGSWRIRSFKKHVDLALCLFPFEEEFLKEHGVKCAFVGHPVIEQLPERLPEKDRSEFTLALLPGSRRSEVENLLPLMLEAAEKIKETCGDMRINLAKTSNLDDELYRDALGGTCPDNLDFFTDDTISALSKSDFAIVTSGTATLETALTKTPFVIIYRASRITYLLFKAFADISEIGLVNIVAKEKLIPELLQKDANAEKIAREVLEIISSPDRQQKMVRGLEKVSESLAGKRPSEVASEKIYDFWKNLK